MTQESLYDRLGGLVTVATLASKIIDASFENPIANSNPNVKHFHQDETHRAEHKFLLTGWLCEKTGGPKCYVGQPLKVKHPALCITGEQFDAVAAAVIEAMQSMDLGEHEMNDLGELLVSYRGDVVTA